MALCADEERLSLLPKNAIVIVDSLPLIRYVYRGVHRSAPDPARAEEEGQQAEAEAAHLAHPRTIDRYNNNRYNIDRSNIDRYNIVITAKIRR